MLRSLFPRLTPGPTRGAALFDALTAQARRPHWYVEGEVPDTIDGRFRVLASVAALAIVRLEDGSEAGEAASVALTERFIHVMEAEHREIGLGDPTLGKTVRKLVGALARRVELWRSTVAQGGEWEEAAALSVCREQASAAALGYSAASLKALWTQLESSDVESIARGEIG